MEIKDPSELLMTLRTQENKTRGISSGEFNQHCRNPVRLTGTSSKTTESATLQCLRVTTLGFSEFWKRGWIQISNSDDGVVEFK
ncbi:hypothetical protein CDAR_59351 [Caerostris darwini]|uniref:Uncharacterized protein n=1 Tax=Caerostris darwini TaxID=1538125 RepID=A0AAV4X3W7_9ARAC|nr:hypothetical protein CDAR_59351 [Caerostris darwini]